MKQGQACRGKGINALYRYGCGVLGRECRRLFWKQHRTAEKAEIRDQLADASHDIVDEYDDDPHDRITNRERWILNTMGVKAVW